MNNMIVVFQIKKKQREKDKIDKLIVIVCMNHILAHPIS